MSTETILAGLEPAFADQMRALLAACAARGVTMVPDAGRRDPATEARLWRQSRSTTQANAAIADLRAKGAPYLAGVLESVGPQPSGPWATNALPGDSWHQLGLACDCYLANADGTPNWDAAAPGYEVYAEEAEKLGLTAGKHWTQPDTTHVQQPKAGAPTDSMSWPDLDAAMKAQYGTTA